MKIHEKNHLPALFTFVLSLQNFAHEKCHEKLWLKKEEITLYFIFCHRYISHFNWKIKTSLRNLKQILPADLHTNINGCMSESEQSKIIPENTLEAVKNLRVRGDENDRIKSLWKKTVLRENKKIYMMVSEN